MRYSTNSIDLFVPGRLCLFGEHSDWASEIDNNKGYAIIVGMEQGIYACANRNSYFIFNYGPKHIKSKMKLCDLKKKLKDDFFKYVIAVAYIMLKKYHVSGIEIKITKNTLPIKKGLSSSAAISVLVVRAFNKLYNLNLSIETEMSLAYEAEHLAGTKCGKMDQICAYGVNKAILMTYENFGFDINNINVSGTFTYLIVDLNSKKNTSRILNDLQSSYKLNDDIKEYLCKTNLNICMSAISYLETGNNKKLGELMNYAQSIFDDVCSKYSIELSAPILHKVLEDDKIKENIYGGKYVGSGGDGAAQLLVKSEEIAIKLIDYIKVKFGMTAYKLTIKEQKKINTAVIPIAGYGTRMYPMTKIINKELLPILDKDKILKPAICILLEELYDSGIEEIILLVGKEDIGTYKSLFTTNYNIHCGKEIKKMVEYLELKFQSIERKLKFIPVDKGLGFAKTVLKCKNIIGMSPFLLVLGDQLYQSNIDKSCTKQLIEFYEHTGNITISCCAIDKNKASLYGILYGDEINENYFQLKDFVEKPKTNLDKLSIKIQNKEKVLAVFGEYILTSEIFDKLENSNDESITESIKQLSMEMVVNGFIVDGKFFDIGNTVDYCKTFDYFYNNTKEE